MKIVNLTKMHTVFWLFYTVGNYTFPDAVTVFMDESLNLSHSGTSDFINVSLNQSLKSLFKISKFQSFGLIIVSTVSPTFKTQTIHKENMM